MTALRQLVLEKSITEALAFAKALAEELRVGVAVSDRDVLCSWVPPES
jgi:hypothetical protein